MLGVISLAERSSLEQYCQAYAAWRECLLKVRTEGLFIATQFGEQENPASVSGRKFADQCIKLLSSFGMTPTSRTRLQIKENRIDDTLEDKYLA